MTDGMIDLGAARAARREAKGTALRVRLGDGEPCELPVEIPVDALAPLKSVQLEKDLGIIFQAQDAQAGERILRDLITVRPTLAGELLDAGKGVLERLFCSCEAPPWLRDEGDSDLHDEDCGWPRFLGWRPTTEDYVELVRGLWSKYGADLGKAFAPSASSGTGGTTSKPTSRGSTRSSTRAASGASRATTGS